MAILEAAQYGKPAIGPNHGGFTEIIEQGDAAIGKLFEPGNVDDLERQVVELWNDSSSCQHLGDKAFEKLNLAYSTEVVGRQWELLLEEIVNRKR